MKLSLAKSLARLCSKHRCGHRPARRHPALQFCPQLEPLDQRLVLSTTNTATTLIASDTSSVFSAPVTLTASVTSVAPATSTPTGTVTFADGTVSLGSTALPADGTASFTISGDTLLPVGVHSITASYSGDSNFAGSTTAPLIETIYPAATTTVLVITSETASEPPTDYYFTATVAAVSPATATPTGMIRFFDEGITIGTANLSNGQANGDVHLPAPGTHTLTALYLGDSDFSLSSSTLTFVQSPGVVFSPPPASHNQLVVTQFYRDLLGREPDSPGLQFWTGLLDQQQASAYQVALGLVNSTEYRMREVENVYHTFLHREADPTGLKDWTQFLQQGHTLEQLELQIGSCSITVGLGAADRDSFSYTQLYEAGASRYPGRRAHAAGRDCAGPSARPARSHPATGRDCPAVA